MAVPGRDLHLCTGRSVGGTGWAARRSSDLGKNESQSKACLAKLAGKNPLQWLAWLSRPSAKQEASFLLLKSNGKETKKREWSQGKGRKENCAHMTEQEDPYSYKHQCHGDEQNSLGHLKIFSGL